MRFSKRMEYLKKSVFSTLNEERQKREVLGLPVYDFTIGSPDIAPSQAIINVLIESARQPKSYMYAIHDLPEFKQAVCDYYFNRYEVELDVNSEVLALQGSQEGLAHIALALCDPGDIVLIPSPSYPVFAAGPKMAGAEIYEMEMLEEYDYLIQFDQIPEDIAQKAKFMILSYPNNPTGAIATDAFYEQAITFAKQYDIMIVSDNAYSNLVFDGQEGRSFLYYEGAKDVGIEFNSFSKSYGMAGARVGICVGNEEMVGVLRTLKSNIDYGMFVPIQKAAIEALSGDQQIVEDTRKTYQKRRDLLVSGFAKAGWPIKPCAATMFLWAKIPEGYATSDEFAMELLKQTGILVTSGSAFGKAGEGYVRLALVQSEELMRSAIQSLQESSMLQ
ncbi:MAG: aminotransferase class I/II-fold pyridoxal phosphate-dependent enzyme [Longicatena sp.]|nr:aminotransferase class I/II-fold pyridoxal phosphate-dependent enzyme [Longicatena sp.]